MAPAHPAPLSVPSPTQPTPLVPARKTQTPAGLTKWVSTYPPKSASIALMNEVLVTLGITKWQLSLALGSGKHTYDWFSGERRPGAMYLSRIAKLLMMKVKGEWDPKIFKGDTFWPQWATPTEPVQPPRTVPFRDTRSKDSADKSTASI